VDNQWFPLRDWKELLDPSATRSLDLAFTLTSMGVITPPVITNVWVTNQVTLTATNQVLGLTWTSDCGVHYQVLSAPKLGGGGSGIMWSPYGPEIIGPNNWYWETNTVLNQRFYRIMAIDP
jgi:hypothetical protein